MNKKLSLHSFFGISSMILGALAVTAASGLAQVVIAQYSFTGSSGASTDSDFNTVAGDFTINPSWSRSNTLIIGSVGGGNPAPGWQVGSFDNGNSTSATESSTAAAGAWFSFTLTPDSEVTVSFSSLSVDVKQSGTGGVVKIHYFLRSSLDNFATTIGSIGEDGAPILLSATSFTTYTMDLSSAAALQGVTSPVTFRLYTGDDRGNNAVGEYFDNVTLSASVVPESRIFGLVLAGGIILYAVGRKRLRKTRAADCPTA